jgi:hypothetical protein
MFPHERSLVKKYANDPFVLLGVNEDPDRSDARKPENEGQVTWRSWWDPGTNRKISSAYGVNGLPALLLIDHRGKIRSTGDELRDERVLEKKIQELIQEAVTDSGKKS